MGCYVNPTTETKESFLEREGREIKASEVENFPDGSLPVALINNSLFSAAAVLYSAGEVREFTRPDDRRPRRYFFVEISKLRKVSPVELYV